MITAEFRRSDIIRFALRSSSHPQNNSMMSDEEIFSIYGKGAIISRKGNFVLVHLDRPTRTVVNSRTRGFDPDEFFHNDCRFCRLAREGGVAVFDDSRFDDDDE